MSEISALFDTLKRQLKVRGITYIEVSQWLGLSHASIKRIFSTNDISLARLEVICHKINMNLSDLLLLMQDQSKRVSQLTLLQEQQIVADERLLLITVCVLNHWTLAEILHYYNLKKSDCIYYLTQLDKLNVIELLPNNRIKRNIAPNFDWIRNGPIHNFFQRNIKSEFMNTKFLENNEQLVFRSGMLSAESATIMRRHINKLTQSFIELSHDDASKSVNELDGTGLLIAIRPWAPSIFDKYKNI